MKNIIESIKHIEAVLKEIKKLLSECEVCPECGAKIQVTFSGAEKTTKTATEVKHKYGEYKNVLLTDTQLEALKKDIPYLDKWVEALSSYKAQSGKVYKSDYAVIKNWYKREAEKKKTVSSPKKSKFNNYTDTNKHDYSNLQEKILKEMMGE